MVETKETLQEMSMFMEMKYLLSYLYMKNETLYFEFRNTYYTYHLHNNRLWIEF